MRCGQEGDEGRNSACTQAEPPTQETNRSRKGTTSTLKPLKETSSTSAKPTGRSLPSMEDIPQNTTSSPSSRRFGSMNAGGHPMTLSFSPDSKCKRISPTSSSRTTQCSSTCSSDPLKAASGRLHPDGSPRTLARRCSSSSTRHICTRGLPAAKWRCCSRGSCTR